MRQKVPIRVAILISGAGSNMANIVECCEQQEYRDKIVVKIVISDNPHAKGLELAQQKGIKNLYIRPGEYKTKLEGPAEDRYISTLKSEGVDIVILAGFMRVVKSKFLSAFQGRCINIHPSLLPFYKGLNTMERAKKRGDSHVGVTLHSVDLAIDSGRVIIQRDFDLSADVSACLKQNEHQIFRDFIDLVANDFITFPLDSRH